MTQPRAAATGTVRAPPSPVLVNNKNGYKTDKVTNAPQRNPAYKTDKVINAPAAADNERGAQLGAYGCTFVLAPTFSLRLGKEDSLLMDAFVRQDGLAVLLQSEMQPRHATGTFRYDIAPGLCEDAQRILTEDNAGGSSSISEAMSLELLQRAFGAALHKTELELTYFPSDSAITDFSIVMPGGVQAGVSVTRALQPPNAPQYGVDAAAGLLRKKLSGVLASTQAVVNADFRKQILHVWAESARIAEVLQQAYATLEPQLTADTVVLITLCRGLPELFHERLAPGAVKRERPLKGLKDARHIAILLASDPCGGHARIH